MRRSVRIRPLFSLLLAVAAMVGSAPSWAAASSAAGADDLRAAYAGPQEVAEGKRVVKQSCAKCHGADGIATTKDMPNLAGQRAPFLLSEMKAYKAGGRSDKSMVSAVKFLSDDAMLAAAAYYASLDPAPPSATKAAPAKADAVSAGKAAAAGCAGCHGDTGITETSGMPSLIGQHPAYLVTAMTAYKSGLRKEDMMQTLVGGLSDNEMKNIALFFALQKTAKAKTPVSGNKAAGKAAATACAGCHGEQGVSSSPATPSLAGQDSEYFVAALEAYKNGSRTDETMKGVADSLENKAMKDLAAYYASLSPQAPKVVKPLSSEEWAQRCDRCHGVDGNSIDPRIPALAAQRVDYLKNALLAYKSGVRKSPQMSAMTAVLNEEDIAGLAAYYARQKPRALIFVPLPAK
ncbi:MAG: c-type cytochrome [Georgfuchsia sp.]